jgi:hypothetical protein
MKRIMSITNRSKVSRALYIEPEGADYWMLPGQTFVLSAEALDDSAHFEVEHDGDGLQIYPSNGMDYISVLCDGEELQCGHQRPPIYQ